MQDKAQVFYLCDGDIENCNKKHCYKCGGGCKHTTDINHAINFQKSSFRSEKNDFFEEEVRTTVKKGKMRKKGAASGCTEITIRFHQTTGTPLKEVLEEIWDLKEEHPDAKINIEVNR